MLCIVVVQITFPPSLTARQRALLHEFAEGAGLQHASTGEGASRRLQLGRADAQQKVRTAQHSKAGPMHNASPTSSCPA